MNDAAAAFLRARRRKLETGHLRLRWCTDRQRDDEQSGVAEVLTEAGWPMSAGGVRSTFIGMSFYSVLRRSLRSDLAVRLGIDWVDRIVGSVTEAMCARGHLIPVARGVAARGGGAGLKWPIASNSLASRWRRNSAATDGPALSRAACIVPSM